LLVIVFKTRSTSTYFQTGFLLKHSVDCDTIAPSRTRDTTDRTYSSMSMWEKQPAHERYFCVFFLLFLGRWINPFVSVGPYGENVTLSSMRGLCFFSRDYETFFVDCRTHTYVNRDGNVLLWFQTIRRRTTGAGEGPGCCPRARWCCSSPSLITASGCPTAGFSPCTSAGGKSSPRDRCPTKTRPRCWTTFTTVKCRSENDIIMLCICYWSFFFFLETVKR